MGDDNTSVTTDEMVTATSPAEEFPNESSTKVQQGVAEIVNSEPVADPVLPSTNGTDSSTNDSEVNEEVRQQVPVQQDLQPETTEAVTNPPEEASTAVVQEPEPVVEGAETAIPVVSDSAVEHTDQPEPETGAEAEVEPIAESRFEPEAESTVEPVVAEPASEAVAEPTLEPVAEPTLEPVANRSFESVDVPTSFEPKIVYRSASGAPFKRQTEPVRVYELSAEPIRRYELPTEPIRGYELPAEPIRGYERPTEPVRGYELPAEVRGYELPTEPEPEPRFEPQAEPEPTVVTPTITETTVVTPTVTEVAVATPVPEPHLAAHQFVEAQPKLEPAEEVATEAASPVVVPAVADPVPTATTTTISTEFAAKEEPAVTEPVNVESIPVVADLTKEEPADLVSAAPATVPTAMAPEPAIETASTMIPSVVAAAVPQPVIVAPSTTPIAVVAPTVKVVVSKPTPAIITNPLPVSVVPVITSTKQNGTSAAQPTAVKTTPKPKPKNNSKPNNAPVAVTTPMTATPKKKSKKKQPEPEPVVDDVKKRRKTWTPEEQKYACKLCNFRSAYASSLGRHVQMSHKDTLSTKDESSCGSTTSSSTPAPAVTPSPTPTPTPTPTPQPVVAASVATPISMTPAAPTAILTIPKTEMPTTTTIVQHQQPKTEEVNFRHVQILQPQQQLLTYEYHPVVSSTYQDVVNNPPIYNTSVRYDTADGIPITLIDPSTHNINFGESEYLQYHKAEDELGTIRSEPTVMNTLGSMAVPVSDIINLPPQSTTLTPLTSADNTIDSVASGLTPDARKRPLVTAVKSKPEDVVAKKRKKEGDGPSFSNVLMSTPTPPTVPSNQPGSTPTPKKKKKKNPAGNNQGGPGTNATPVKTAPPSFANASTPSTKGKTDKNGDDTPGKKKKPKKPSDKPSNPCLITSTSSSCPVCSFSTKYQFNLARHFQATHKDELQKVLNGTVSYPGIRKREMKEKSSKPKPKSKEKKPKQPAANDQSSQSSQYSSSQNNSSQLSVAQEFEQFVRDENLEMFAEADNLDLSEPMVSSFIESLFSADMGAAEGWNNVGNHQVVLNPSVHPQTIATTAYIQHPVQPGTQMQAVSQGGYVTTVDLLQHQTQGQVVGGYITQPQQLYEFQKAPHSNPIQANVVINGVTTTMDLNSVIEKNTSQLHVQQPENPSHQSQSKVFIAQSSESHTTATAGVPALDLNSSQHFQGQQQNGFTGHLPQHLASTDHLAKWTSQQQQQQVIISSSVQNQQQQWSQSQVYTQQSQQYTSTSNPSPATVQYHTPAGTIINHPIEAPPFAQWQSQPQQVHQNHPIQSTIQISAESRPLTTVDTSFLHSALADNSHHLSSSQLVGSVSGTPAPPSLVTVSSTNSNATAAPATGNTPVKRPSPKKKKKAPVPPPAPAPVTTPASGKKKTDVDALSPEEREKRERYLQKRRERWKVSQERKKQLKNAQNVDGGSSTSDSNSVASSVPVNQQNHQLPPHSLVSSPLLSLESPAFLRLDESFLSLPPSRPVCTVTSSLRSPIFSVPSTNSIVTNTSKPDVPPSISSHVVEEPDLSCESPIKQLTLSAVLDLADRSKKQKKQVTFSAVPKSSKEARREYMRIYNKNRPPRNQSKKQNKSSTKVDSVSTAADMPPKKRGKNPPKSNSASPAVHSSQPNPAVAARSVSSPVTRGGTGKIQKPKGRSDTSVPSRPAIKHEDVEPARRSNRTPLNKPFPDKNGKELQAIKKERQAQLAKERQEALEQRRRSLMGPIESACVPAVNPRNSTFTDEKPAIGKELGVKVETSKVENQELVAFCASTSLEAHEAELKTSESVIFDLQLPYVAQNCNFSECTFVANNVFELEFHENIHRTAKTLPPVLAQILESSGKLPEALSLRPCIDPLFDTSGVAAAIPQVTDDDGDET